MCEDEPCYSERFDKEEEYEEGLIAEALQNACCEEKECDVCNGADNEQKRDSRFGEIFLKEGGVDIDYKIVMEREEEVRKIDRQEFVYVSGIEKPSGHETSVSNKKPRVRADFLSVVTGCCRGNDAFGLLAAQERGRTES